MLQEVVRFNATDGIKLDGFITKSDKPSKKIYIFVHGMISNCFKDRDACISKALNDIGIDTFGFNNRGSEVARIIKSDNGFSKMSGTAYEEVTESYYDICGAIDFALSKGYEEVYLQGHSLGSTKVVYSYNRMLKESYANADKVKALVILSLVDIPNVFNYFGKKYIAYAEDLVSKGHGDVIIQDEALPYPLSLKTFLRYAKDGADINFANFGNEQDNFEVLNSFKIPLFFRWGNVREILLMDVNKQVEFVKAKIHNERMDVGFIDGGDHSYHGKEEQLAGEIADFIKSIL